MCKDPRNDQELVSEFLKGNEDTLQELIVRHERKIFTSIYLLVKDRDLANDIFQETFIKVIKTLRSGNYNEEGKFLPWAQRIAHNLVIDYFRKKNKIRIISECNSFDEEYSIFYKIASDEKNYLQTQSYNELETQMVNLISHLPNPQKEMIEMRIFQDMSFKEIAELEDISINTALGRMRYALINMRKLIEKHNMVTEIA